MHSWRAWDLLDLVEYRGDVFSIGGNANQFTIANWLKVMPPLFSALVLNLPKPAIQSKLARRFYRLLVTFGCHTMGKSCYSGIINRNQS